MQLFADPLCVFQTLLLLLSSQIANAATYNLLDDFSGKSFFDKWDFYGKYDNLTSGDVNWLDRNGSVSEGLVSVNSDGNVVMKVSMNTVVSNNKRDSVRVTTQRAYPAGTIWITDVIHLPVGCSVWPAIWTKGQNWPADGEIDILEGINLNTNNQMALHTRPGCMHVSNPNQSGKSLEANCSKDAGCTVSDNDPASYGTAFNEARGGIWATQFTNDGIYIWFWSRSKIPSSVTSLAGSKSPITSLDDWGIPTASYPGGSNCNISQAFTAQNIVIDITLCGVWAGIPQLYQLQCDNRGKTDNPCYIDNVIGNGTNYQNAYFEIKYVRAYLDSTVTSGAAEVVTQSPVMFVFAVVAIVLGSIASSL